MRARYLFVNGGNVAAVGDTLPAVYAACLFSVSHCDTPPCQNLRPSMRYPAGGLCGIGLRDCALPTPFNPMAERRPSCRP